ncbi:MAG: pentapeptide repeat-containing protein, partial [Pleurocapsa sp.]
AHLSGINLSKANLAQANFNQSILNQANFSEACLEKACLIGAVLIEANLTKANLSGANLLRANLSNANLKGAIYDSETIFPADFDPARRGMLNQCNVEELLAEFYRFCKCSNKYLGNTMTAKYFNSSRPDCNWLKQFTINSSGQVICEKNLVEPVTSEHIKFFQQWLDNFFKSCSLIIRGFEKLI